MSSPNSPRILVAPSKAEVSSLLCTLVGNLSVHALKDHNAVSIALSGGSLPSFLAALPEAFKDVDPQWNKWHIFLADERCVSDDHEDSNLKALKEKFLSKTSIPETQIYGIDQTMLEDPVGMAQDYETRLVKSLNEYTNGKIDIALLGFGPDGHTCSLFPDHKLVQGGQPSDIWVASIEDSPKPPLRRITLTLPVLNGRTGHIILCGAGSSKQPVIAKVFKSIKKLSDEGELEACMATPPPYPCAMVTPNDSLTWVLDKDALGDKNSLDMNL
jgi:6-phosphogluconolactonase